jgi:hypothetical protein
MERVVADGGDTLGDRNTGQAAAIIERLFADGSDAIGDRNASQFPAIFEYLTVS